MIFDKTPDEEISRILGDITKKISKLETAKKRFGDNISANNEEIAALQEENCMYESAITRVDKVVVNLKNIFG